jgi:acetyl esterase/lipase
MARLTRRGFIAASSALAAAPALSALKVQAQGPAAPDIGNLRAERDIVFGKAGTMELKLDVYQPPAGVTAKRTAIIHLFGGGFFSGNKSAGYIINDAKALGARGYTNISANYRLAKEGFWPAQIHDVKAAIRWTRANAAKLGIEPNRIVVAGYSAGGMLSLMAAGTNGKKEFEGDLGNPGVSSDVNASIGVYPRWRARRLPVPSSHRGRPRPRTSPRRRRRPTSAPRSRRRSSSTARTTARSPWRRALTSSRSSTRSRSRPR